MKKTGILSLVLLLAGLTGAQADVTVIRPAPAADPAVSASVENTVDIRAGKPVTVLFRLDDAEKNNIRYTDLQEVGDQRIQAFVIDQGLDDFRQVHPIPRKKGRFAFVFIPRHTGQYTVWLGMTLKATGRREYVNFMLGAPGVRRTLAQRIPNTRAYIGQRLFTLAFTQPPQPGRETVGTVTITDKQGNPTGGLEPVQGAFAHVVGFGEQARTILPAHVRGRKPQFPMDRSPPEVVFHIHPEKAGFFRFFLQVRLDDMDVTAPFGVEIADVPPPTP